MSEKESTPVPNPQETLHQVEKTGFEDGFVSEFPEYDEYGPKLRKVAEAKILTEEEKATLFTTLERRFLSENTPLKEFHKNMDWSRVRESLEADEQSLLKVYKLEQAGHEPDVYEFDSTGFRIGTCSIESPATQRECTYPESLRMAEDTGALHMEATEYKALQRNGGRKFDRKTWSWLKASDLLMDVNAGSALVGGVYAGEVTIYQARPEDKGKLGSWRGTVTVNWKV